MLPFWAWFHIAKKIAQDDFPHTDKKGLPDLKKPSYRFGQRLTLPANYWDGGPWATPLKKVSSDDPGGPRSRLFVYLQGERVIRFYISNRFFPRGTGLNWRYEVLREFYGLSAEDARLVLGIEEGKEYSEPALWTARHRERKAIKEEIGSAPDPFIKSIREIYPYAEVVRVPTEFPPFWPADLVRFFEEKGLKGSTWWVPRSRNYVRVFASETPSTASSSL